VATINTSKSYLRYCTTKNGLEVVIKQIEKEFEVLHVVLGVVNDKDLNEILPLFPKKAHYYFLQIFLVDSKLSTTAKLQHST
jgi:dihydrofolate synthase/folylpolyglutamate synthase